jgi:HEAT repeat protein
MANADDIAKLITDLGAGDWGVRHQARESLLDIGPTAVEPVSAALASANAGVRWGAAKVLEQIGDARAIPGLVERLEDSDGSVRYLAAEALAKVGDAAVLPVLRALLKNAGSQWLQEGAHHVLRARLAGNHAAAISPVIAALEGPDRAMAVLPRLNDALKAVEGAA